MGVACICSSMSRRNEVAGLLVQGPSLVTERAGRRDNHWGPTGRGVAGRDSRSLIVGAVEGLAQSVASPITFPRLDAKSPCGHASMSRFAANIAGPKNANLTISLRREASEETRIPPVGMPRDLGFATHIAGQGCRAHGPTCMKKARRDRRAMPRCPASPPTWPETKMQT